MKSRSKRNTDSGLSPSALYIGRLACALDCNLHESRMSILAVEIIDTKQLHSSSNCTDDIGGNLRRSSWHDGSVVVAAGQARMAAQASRATRTLGVSTPQSSASE